MEMLKKYNGKTDSSANAGTQMLLSSIDAGVCGEYNGAAMEMDSTVLQGSRAFGLVVVVVVVVVVVQGIPSVSRYYLTCFER